MFQRRLKCLSNRPRTKSPVKRYFSTVHTINIPSDDALDKLRMPKFEFPWPSACSPYVYRIEEETVQWTLQHNLIPNDRYLDRVKRSLLGHLLSRWYPQADYKLLRTITDYLLWFILTDDMLFDRVETLGPHTVQNLTAIIDIVDCNRLGDEEFYGKSAWFDVCQRLRVQLTDEHFQRFANGIRSFCCAIAFQIVNHLRPGRTVDVKTYETVRFYAGNMNSFLDLVDIANGAALPAKTFYRPEVQIMRRCANNVICWTNDIYSLYVELNQPGQQLNMVTIYAAQGSSLQQAIDCTAGRVRGEITEFVRISRNIGSLGEKDLTGYVTGLQNYMRGHQDWLDNETQRYSRTFANEDADDRGLL